MTDLPPPNRPQGHDAATTSRYAVKHRDGWCAVERGHKPAEGEWNTPTACGMFVVGPFGFERGLKLVTCENCRV